MHRRDYYRREIDLRPSLRSRAYSAALRLMLRTRVTPDTDVAALRRQFAKLDARHVVLDRSIVRTPVERDGVPAEWISVPESREERVLLYLRGGSFAFRFANAHAALVARLCRNLHARALVPDYRLAPEHPFPAGIGSPALRARCSVTSARLPPAESPATTTSDGAMPWSSRNR